MKSEIEKRLAHAELICQKAGSRLTDVRRAILALIFENDKCLTAYEILSLLKKNYPKAEAMTVYRGLTFLQTQQLIHRVASQNTYTACDKPQHQYHSQLLLCDGCGSIQEINIKHIEDALQQTAEAFHFVLSAKPIEITGLCRNCQSG